MNEILNILNEHEEWLQEEYMNFNDKSLANGLIIENNGGTNFDQYHKIIEDIEISLNYAVKIITDKGIKGIVNDNILTDNTFLYKPKLEIFYDNNAPYNAKINIDKCVYSKKYNALENVLITYYEEKSLFPNVNIKRLKRKLWHELHHAYVVYQVKKKEFEKEQINFKKANERKLYSDVQNNTEIKNSLKQTYYYTNVEEINAHLNEMIPYLEEHEEIDFTNYRNYLNSIPGYDIIDTLKEGQNSLNIIMDSGNVEVMNAIGTEVISVYNKQPFYQDKKLGAIQAFNFLVSRINKAIIYTQKEFYKMLAYTLEKLNRKQRYAEYVIRKGTYTAEDFRRDWEKDFGIKQKRKYE